MTLPLLVLLSLIGLLEKCVLNKFIYQPQTSCWFVVCGGSEQSQRAAWARLPAIFSEFRHLSGHHDVKSFWQSKPRRTPWEATSVRLGGNLITWLESYLYNRFQWVTTLGATSNSLSVTSGVPQGSIFVFVPSVCQVSARCSYIKPDCRFCKWYKGLKEITSKHDAEQLQGDLSDLITWSDSAGLNFKYRKCKGQRITRKLKPVNFDYCIADSQLEVVSAERDLGV